MGMMGMPGGGDNSDGGDENPDLIVVVVEIGSPSAKALRDFNTPINPRGGPGGGTERLKARHRWGSVDLIRKNDAMEAVVLKTAAGKPLKSVKTQFNERQAELDKTPNTDESIKLARWALGNGLLNDFEKVMDKLAETEKSNSFVTSYLEVKANLAKPIAQDAIAKPKGTLLKDYRLVQSDKHHYAILHNGDGSDLKDFVFMRPRIRAW